jgi:phage tail sheath protein FI
MLQDGNPGVHIIEVPSGVRTIVGASTSNLAMIGHFPRGPVDRAVRVSSWADVERVFGGLDRRFVAAYALQEFYQQGGSTAFVARVAFQNASVTLTTTEDAMRVDALTTGASTVTVAFSNNSDGSFNMAVARPAPGPINESFLNLSTEIGAPRFAETLVNAPIAAGGSALVHLSAVRHLPAETVPGTLAAAVPPASMSGLAGGNVTTAASFVPQSVPLPALTLQAMASGAAANAFTAAVVANVTPGLFDLVLTGTGSPSAPSTANVSVDPADARYIVNILAASGFARVVVGRHPLRVPRPTAARPFAGGGAAVPSATGILPRAGGGNAIRVTAANPGGWGNSLRVGVAAATGGFDLLVAEFVGGQRVRSETYRNLNITPNDPANAETVIRQQSALIRLSEVTFLPGESAAGVELDDLTLAQMVPLGGGEDGVLPAEPAWAGSAAGAFQGGVTNPVGLVALDGIVPEIFNLMAIPEAPLMADLGVGLYAAAGAYCRDNLAFLLVDHPDANDGTDTILGWDIAAFLGSDLARSAAICFPRILRSDPLGGVREMPASGSIAGVMARTDASRGVWKAPAGLDASLGGVTPSVIMTDRQQGRLNQRGINCLRAFPNIGTVNFGARTLAGADSLASEWKYVPIRRTALFLEQTLKASLPWVVFEPNDEALWAQIRLNVGAFMQSLFVRGAFQGATPRDAYLVKCDAETTSQQDVNAGIVNILVGFAPLRPAEFVVVRLTQLAGRLAA